MAIIEVSKQITNYLDSEEMVTAPANPVEGQRWTDTSKSPPVAMIYKDGEWKPERLSVEVLDPDFYQDLENNKAEVATAIEKAEAAEKAGEDAQAAGEAAQSAASEAKQAGENAANLASQATLDAQAAKAKADAIQIDVNGLVSDVATINGTVTAISSKANEAYEKAAAVEGRTATLETSVTGLTGRMTDIETTSTSNTKKLNELVVTVDGQKQTIATATTTADSALNKANVLETTVDGVTQTLTSVETTANSALSKVNTVSSTVDGHTQLIASTKTTADSALSKAVATETTVNGLKTTVSSVETTANTALTKATQVEATASGIRQTVTEVQENISDLVNFFPDTKFTLQNPKPTIEGTGVTVSYDSNGIVIQNAGTTRQRVYWGVAPIALTVGKTYNVKAYMNTGTAGGTVEIGTSGGENMKVSPDAAVAKWIQGTIKSTTYTAFSIWVEAGKAVRFRELYIYEANTDVTSSQITQLATDINLKVDKDGVIAQINVSSEGILIDGKYTWITGTTKIDNAVIKTAHIADLAVSNGKIANLAVTEGKIGNLAVTTAKIADLAVNNAKIASLDAAKINTGYLAAARIAASSITTDKLNVATLSAITANLGNVTAGTINGLEILGGSYTQSATMTDPNSGKSGISEIKIASGVLTNSFNSTDSSVSRQTTLSSGVLRFLNLGSEFGRLQSNSDKGSSTVPALEISGTFVAITSSQRGWINLSANGVFEGNTYNGYSVDAASNTGNYIGFNRNSSDKMNFFVGKTADGTKRMGSDDLYASSGSGKALHITSGGSIVAYSSSERFKEYIETASDVNPKSLLNLDLKSWIYKSSHSLVSVGEPIRRVYGLIAEDVERAGLNQYVERDINGRVEGYKPELWTVTIPILKEHEESIETLKQKVQKLEEKIEALQAA